MSKCFNDKERDCNSECEWWGEEGSVHHCLFDRMLFSIGNSVERIQDAIREGNEHMEEIAENMVDLHDELLLSNQKKTRGMLRWVLKIVNSVVDKVLDEEDEKQRKERKGK